MALIDVTSAQATYPELYRSGEWTNTMWTEAVARSIGYFTHHFEAYGGISTTASYYVYVQTLANTLVLYYLNHDADLKTYVDSELESILVGLPLVGTQVIGDSPVFVQTGTTMGIARRKL